MKKSELIQRLANLEVRVCTDRSSIKHIFDWRMAADMRIRELENLVGIATKPDDHPGLPTKLGRIEEKLDRLLDAAV